MHTYRFIYSRCTPRGRILEHVTDTISAHTAKSAKHALVKRFGLQHFSPWRKNSKGNFVKTLSRPTEHSKIILELEEQNGE
ncbi:MAG: hypothetical protein OXL96_13815 [Candidatus Poribacteria bacterium]|nr:hypothetical protein [Candidatus Poribacteria bacterium]